MKAITSYVRPLGHHGRYRGWHKRNINKFNCGKIKKYQREKLYYTRVRGREMQSQSERKRERYWMKKRKNERESIKEKGG